MPARKSLIYFDYKNVYIPNKEVIALHSFNVVVSVNHFLVHVCIY